MRYCPRCKQYKPTSCFYRDSKTAICKKCKKAEVYARRKRIAEGKFEGDPDGYGTVTYKNGARFEGFFKKGKRHGLGTFTFCDGERVPGIWKNGVIVLDREDLKVETY